MTSVAPHGSVSSPWTQIFRVDSDALLAPPSVASPVIEQLETSDSDDAKRLAWNKPSTGSEPAEVMGADSWPALSDSTKPPSKSPTESSDSSPFIQVATTSSISSQKLVNPPNREPARQKRNGGGKTSTNGGFPQPAASPAPLVDVSPTNHSPKIIVQKSGFGSHSHNINNHPQRNSFRNRNGGPRPRGDGSHDHSYGGMRDQDRVNQDWNAHRYFSGRDAHVHQHRVGPRFVAPPPPPSSAAFMPPSSVRHFGSPIGFPEMAPVYFVATPPPESLCSGVPFLAPMPPHAAFSHAPVLEMHGKIVNQIDYYFSNDNLVKDTYLRQNMDEQGWVPIKLLAGFKQVKLLTENVQLIADAVRASTLVEVQGKKVRRRNDWMKWIIPPTFQFSNRQATSASKPDMLATGFQGLNLEKVAYNNCSPRDEADFKFGELNRPADLPSSEEAGESSVPSIKKLK